jgi:phasin family protein
VQQNKARHWQISKSTEESIMNTHPAIPEQISAVNQAGTDVVLRAAGIGFEGAERLIELNLKTAKAAFAESAKVVKSISSLKDMKELAGMKPAVLQPVVEKNAAYLRGLWEIASDTQAELVQLLEERVTQLNKTVVTNLDKVAKSGPAGSDVAVAAVKSAIAAANSAYDSAVKAAKQVANLTEANVAAASQVVSVAKRKAA